MLVSFLFIIFISIFLFKLLLLLFSSFIPPHPFFIKIKIPVSSYNKDEYWYPRCHLNLLLKILIFWFFNNLFFQVPTNSSIVTYAYGLVYWVSRSVVCSEVFFRHLFNVSSHYTKLTVKNNMSTFPLQRTLIIA